MRVLIVDTFYPAFLDAHYTGDPGLRDAPYAEQWHSLMRTSFGTADAYSHYLRQLGHEAHEIVVNCGPLQDAWRREHGISPAPSSGPLAAQPPAADLIAAQVDDFAPDVLYLQDLAVVDAGLLRVLGRGRLLVGQSGTEPPEPQQLRAFDLILTSFPHYVERFRALGVAREYFRIGFDPRALDRVGELPRDIDAVFVGSLLPSPRWKGNALLDRASGRLPLDTWGIGATEWPEGSALRRRYRGEAWGIEMLRLLGRARIVVNRHGAVAEDYANNMRLYEATGMGALLLTEAKRNLSDLFEVGREVVAYEGVEELIGLASYYLEHEDERRGIAVAGQQRTLAEHTYAHRMRELDEILSRYRR